MSLLLLILLLSLLVYHIQLVDIKELCVETHFVLTIKLVPCEERPKGRSPNWHSV